MSMLLAMLAPRKPGTNWLDQKRSRALLPLPMSSLKCSHVTLLHVSSRCTGGRHLLGVDR